MDFKDKVREHLGKKPKERTKEEQKKRKNFISIIEAKAGLLSSVPFDKIDTKDLFAIANAITGKVARR